MENLFIYEKNGNRRKAEYEKCLECKALFLRRIYPNKDGNKKKFCSQGCVYAYKARTIEKFHFKCNTCGVDCKRSKSKHGSSRHGYYFCSRECKEIAQSLKGDCQKIRPKHYGSEHSNYTKLISRTENPKCNECGENKKISINSSPY